MLMDYNRTMFSGETEPLTASTMGFVIIFYSKTPETNNLARNDRELQERRSIRVTRNTSKGWGKGVNSVPSRSIFFR